MSGYVPERSLAYPANHLSFEIPTSLYTAVLTATCQAERAGTPADWMQLHTTGPQGRVVEFCGRHILPALDAEWQHSPFIRNRRHQGNVAHPTLVGDFRIRTPWQELESDKNMVVQAHTITSRRMLSGLVGRRAIFLTTYRAPFMEPHKDMFSPPQPDC